MITPEFVECRTTASHEKEVEMDRGRSSELPLCCNILVYKREKKFIIFYIFLHVAH